MDVQRVYEDVEVSAGSFKYQLDTTDTTSQQFSVVTCTTRNRQTGFPSLHGAGGKVSVFLEEVRHDAHLRYSHMTLICTLRSYAFRRKQFARVADSLCLRIWTMAKYKAETELTCIDLVF